MSIHIITPTWFVKKNISDDKNKKKQLQEQNEYMKWYEELVHTKA